MSKPFIEFVHPDDRERTLGQNRQVRGGGQARSFENRYLCKDGSYRWLLWNAAPDSSHGVIYSVARDITERKRAEEERERLVTELQAALAEVGTSSRSVRTASAFETTRTTGSPWTLHFKAHQHAVHAQHLPLLLSKRRRTATGSRRRTLELNALSAEL